MRQDNRGKAKWSVEVKRYDRIETRYLTTGDFAALQQLNTDYPEITRVLIEDVLQLGEISDPEINSRFLNYYQDTLLQKIISDVELQYGDMSDINKQLTSAFKKMKELIPGARVPYVYAQIGALNQSIIVADGAVCIYLDKYLGAEYPVYERFYTEKQREYMGREYIVPDCISFYLLSLYPSNSGKGHTRKERSMHAGKIMWTVNKLVGKKIFKSERIDEIDEYMKTHRDITIDEMLRSAI